MWFSDVCIAFVWATGLALATPSVSNIDLMVNTRHGPGKSSSDTVKALGRALTAASRERRNNIFTNHTSIEKSWTDATLLTLYVHSFVPTVAKFYDAHTSFREQDIRKGNVAVAGSVEVICTRCYVKAKATAQLTVNGSFNATAAFNNVSMIQDFPQYVGELRERPEVGVNNMTYLRSCLLYEPLIDIRVTDRIHTGN